MLACVIQALHTECYGILSRTCLDQSLCAAGNAAAYMCGEGEGSATAEATAEATATLFAKAVAEASASCDICGEGSGYANAYAKATAVAEEWLVAYAEAFSQASVCNKCDAFAQSWGYVEEYVFLKAVAESKATVSSCQSHNMRQALSAVFSVCCLDLTFDWHMSTAGR